LDREIEPLDESRVTAPGYALLRADATCWKCGQTTPVVALWVPSFTLDDGAGEPLVDADPAVLQYVQALPPDAVAHLQQRAPWLRPAHTVGSQTTYWANHCVACDAIQGDRYLFGPEGPFFPQTAEELRRIRFVRIDSQLSCTAQPGSSSWMAQVATDSTAAGPPPA
jgi:thiol-disulfide isomerase/thioredoxin